MHVHLIYSKGATAISGARNYGYPQKIICIRKINLYPTLYLKINVVWITNLSINIKTYQACRKRGNYLDYLKSKQIPPKQSTKNTILKTLMLELH